MPKRTTIVAVLDSEPKMRKVLLEHWIPIPRSRVAMVEHRYDPPFEFAGTIEKLTFDLDPHHFGPSKKP